MQEEKPFLRVLEFRAFDSGVVFAVEGEIDLATVDQLTRAIEGVWHRADAATIDLRRVSFIDCLGMRALLRAEQRGRRARLPRRVHPGSPVGRARVRADRRAAAAVVRRRRVAAGRRHHRLSAAALRNRDFALLFSGGAISIVGDALFPVALAFAVLELSGSASSLGLVLAAQGVPLAALALVGGVVGDRVSRQRVMLASDLVRAARRRWRRRC